MKAMVHEERRHTTTDLCGSDLHVCEGRTVFESSRWFGRENMGDVGTLVRSASVEDYDALLLPGGTVTHAAQLALPGGPW